VIVQQTCLNNNFKSVNKNLVVWEEHAASQ
jgi:hypothetical protein